MTPREIARSRSAPRGLVSQDVLLRSQPVLGPYGLSGSSSWRALCSGAPLSVLELGCHLTKLAEFMPWAIRSHVAQIVLGDAFTDGDVGSGLGTQVSPGLDAAGSHGPSRVSPPRGRQRDLLPLVFGRVSAEDLPHPTSSRLGALERFRKTTSWVLLMIAMLNFHYNLGHGARAGALQAGPPTEPQYAALVRLYAAADVLAELNPGSLEGVDWRENVTKSKVAYDGEEVCTAVPLTFARVLPTLPPKGAAGCIPIADLLTGFTREAILDPTLVRRRPEDVDGEWPRPRANLAPGESWDAFLTELFNRGLCEVVAREAIWTHDGKEVRNGVFGVEKPTAEDKMVDVDGIKQSRVRLITNLVPSNALQFRIDGDQNMLPMAGQWSAIHLQPFEALLGSERDRFCYFYFFLLPPVWRGAMALVGLIDPVRLGLERGPEAALAFVCPGMGWISSVGVTQQAHRRMLQLAEALPVPVDSPCFEAIAAGVARQAISSGREVCESHVFDPLAEIRKDRPLPINGGNEQLSLWGVYIDNLTEDEIVLLAQLLGLVGTTSPGMDRADKRYLEWSSGGSDDKIINREANRTSLGSRFSGILGRIDTPQCYCLKLVGATLWLLSQERVQKRWVQVVVGRWVRQMLTRRASLVSFTRVWTWIARSPPVARLPDSIVGEFFSACCLLPLCFTDLRSPISDEVSATDASEAAGGICRSVGLTPRGRLALQNLGPRLDGGSADDFLIVGLFDGISAVRVAWDLLGLATCGFISIDICPNARRVVSAAWAGVVLFHDVHDVTPDLVASWRRQFPTASFVLLCAGFPCQDLSQANFGGLGLAGDKSSLFWVFVRIRDWFVELFVAAIIFVMGENVQGMPFEDLCAISQALELSPYAFCASLCGWVRRPRYWWINWTLAEFDGLTISAGASLGKGLCVLHVGGRPDRGPTSRWLGRNSVWEGEEAGRCLPTFMRWVPRKSRPSRPNGIQQCSAAEIEAWAATGWACSPYNFAAHNCVLRGSGVRTVPSILERERLMGFPERYTQNVMSSSATKSQPREAFAIRCSVIGNSMSVYCLAFMLATLGLQLGFLERFPSRAEVREGRAAQCVRGSSRQRQALRSGHDRGLSEGQRVVCWHIAQVGSRGSDVRLTTGQLVQPYRVRYQAIDVGLWRWKVVRGFCWRHAAHINELEARAGLTDLRRRTRSKRHIGSKYLHLFDSQVCLGVMTKKRSSAYRLERVIRRANALELAAFVHPFYSYVRSSDNPADKPSRAPRLRPKRSRGPLVLHAQK